MKKFSLALLLGAIICIHAKDSGDTTGKTFYAVRPLYHSAMPEKESLFYDRAFAKECGREGALQLVPFYSRTTKSKDLAAYFMYCDKTELLADNTSARNGSHAGIADLNENLARDINVTHFNIFYISQKFQDDNLFKSTIIFRPRQTIFGIGITWRQYLSSDFIMSICPKKWWIELSGPLYHIKNDMRLKEINKRFPPQGVLPQSSKPDMTEAFKGGTTNLDIKFGKIDGSRKKTGFADMEIKLGYDWVCENAYHANVWLGVLVPTGNKPKAEYLFEPIIGHNHHWGIMAGANHGLELWPDCSSTMHWEIACASSYLFKNKQMRMFDLKFRPWSRYMLVKDVKPDASISDPTLPPGNLINGSKIFTRKMQVTPRFQCNINSAFVYTNCNMQAELGYNFWARQSEKVRLDEPWQEGPVISGEAVNTTADTAPVNRLNNIGNNNIGAGVNYTNETRIKAEDLDLASATHEAALSHTIYGALGYSWNCWCWPTFVGVGGSYEFSAANTAVNRWTVWGKLGISL